MRKTFFDDIERAINASPVVELLATMTFLYSDYDYTFSSEPLVLSLSLPLFLSGFFYFFIFFLSQSQFSSAGISPLLARRLPRAGERATELIGGTKFIHSFQKAILSLKCRRASCLPNTGGYTGYFVDERWGSIQNKFSSVNSRRAATLVHAFVSEKIDF